LSAKLGSIKTNSEHAAAARAAGARIRRRRFRI
jgi:hypothetical protein